MDGDWNTEAGTGRRQALSSEGHFFVVDEISHGPAKSFFLFGGFLYCPAEKDRCLFCHAEPAVSDGCSNILRGLSRQGDLKIVDYPGTVHGEHGDESPLHEVDEDGVEPNLDYMGTHGKADGRLVFFCQGQGLNDL
jgi:hypothetical protein